ncbi:hypothetical protein LRS06_09380 [Hymenobacter sp. J193]|uniref:hypothetical protein n=1 Tax=Hymenobacter sp. J193 TaxID=2898429 RepID=UPI002150E93C|nr:hypothetical protein [Hymenobacter sp. J193]MCR5887988.1 hypothetical protein [Hymenobacter sp. J193]
MARLLPKRITLDYRYGYAFTLFFSFLMLLFALPFLWFEQHKELSILWILALIIFNLPMLIWPVRTVYATANRFIIKALFRKPIIYPLNEFKCVRIGGCAFRIREYMVFADGKEYPFKLDLSFMDTIKYSFYDKEKQEDLLNKRIRNIVAGLSSDSNITLSNGI